jgi:hypothetical protein
MVAQIINGTIDPSWILLVLAGIIGFFLVRTLNKIEKKLEDHDKQIGNITKIQQAMLTRLGVEDDFYDNLVKP